MTVLSEQDHQHVLSVMAWFSDEAMAKYTRGVAEHGGHLPDKGGMLAEAEAECLDLPIYLRTLRDQLRRIESWLEHGRVEDAKLGLHCILHGTPADRLPQE